MIQGVLLAAGDGLRFKASHSDKSSDKLLMNLPGTQSTVLETTAANMQQVTSNCLAVIQPDQQARRSCLELLGVEVISCEQAANGMGYALAHAVKQKPDAAGWLIMLADMPWISPALIEVLCQELTQPNQVTLPVYQGQYGHPVLFGERWREALMSLTGDRGARALIQAHPDQVISVEWEDDTILRDVDVLADLNREC